MAFASLGLRAGLATLAFRSTPQRTCFNARFISTRATTSLLRSKAAAPLYLSRRTYASKVPAEETVTETAASTLPGVESLPLDAATTDPLTVTDTIVQSIPPVAYGDFAALGLSSWSPIGLIAWTFELVNVATGLPWFWTIVAGSAICRFTCIPFALRAIRAAGRLKPIQAEASRLQARVSQAQATKDVIAMQRAGLEMKALYAKAGVNPLTDMLLPNLIQLPINIGMFFALRRICESSLPQLHDGGVGAWFWANDLAAMDPHYVLPVVFTALINLQITVGGRDVDTASNAAAGHLMNLFRGMSLLTVFFMSHFPAGLFVGLITTSTLTTAQSLILRNNGVRRFLNIPIQPKSLQGKLPTIRESLVFAREKFREASMKQ